MERWIVGGRTAAGRRLRWVASVGALCGIVIWLELWFKDQLVRWAVGHEWFAPWIPRGVWFFLGVIVALFGIKAWRAWVRLGHRSD